MATAQQVYRNALRGGPYSEDVLDEIFSLDAEETPFYNRIGDRKANSIWHSWQKRANTLRADNARTEGQAFATASMDNTILGTRLDNWCQIFRRHPRVTGTQQAVETIGIADLMADQIRLANIGIKTDMEHALLQGTMASAPTAAKRLKGAIQAMTYVTTFTGVTWTETKFNDMHENGYNRNARLRDVFVNGRVKRYISFYTASQTKYVYGADKRIVNAVDVYESDFYINMIHLCRDIPTSGLLAVDVDMFAKAWLRRPRRYPSGIPEDAESWIVDAEMTLEFGHPGAGAYRKGLNIGAVA